MPSPGPAPSGTKRHREYARVYEPAVLVAIAGTFLLAGTVKGVIGLGLPSISLGLLAAALDLTSAMALLLVPSFVTNLWQALVGGHGRMLLRRLWPFLSLATVTVWAGAAALTRVNLDLLSALLGVLLAAYGAASLAGVRFSLDRRAEARAGPVLGIVNGVLTGMTGSFVVPGVMYLQAIGLARDALIQAMGMLFTVSFPAVAVSAQAVSAATHATIAKNVFLLIGSFSSSLALS